jgi:hypothetical protein
MELLEPRLTPALLDFVPIPVVAVNPQPLPPSASVELDPLVRVASVPGTAQTTSSPILVQGHLSESGQIMNPASATAPTSWSVDAWYTLTGRASETLKPPGSASQDSTINASYQMSGQEVMVLTVQGPGGSQRFIQVDTLAVSGSLVGTDSPRDPVSHQETGKRIWEQVTSVKGLSVSPSFGAWLLHATSDSSGTLIVTEQPPPSSLASPFIASFAQQDVVTACLVPATAVEHPPEPRYQIDAAFDAQGSLTEHLVPPGPTTIPPGPTTVPSGLVFDQSDYSETVTPPSTTASGGPIEVPRQVSRNKGDYQNLETEPGL